MTAKIKNNAGFSLLEIILVVFIIAALASSAFVWFFGYRRQIELDSGAKMIADILRDAQYRVEALLHVLDKPFRFLQLARELMRAAAARARQNVRV